MIINIENIDGKEVYWYDDPGTNKCVIGLRGGPEYKIYRWDIIRAEDRFRLENGRPWTMEEGFRWAYKWARKESEYVDFEEVPNNVLPKCLVSPTQRPL